MDYEWTSDGVAQLCALSLDTTPDFATLSTRLGRSPKAVAMKLARLKRATQPRLAPVAPAGVSLLQLRQCSCRWPLWTDGAPFERQFYCGEPQAAGSSYCERHAARSARRER